MIKNAARQMLESFLAPVLGAMWTPPKPPFDPKINRWTGKPHEHKRENARRTTPPGSGIRRTLYEQARLRIFQD